MTLVLPDTENKGRPPAQLPCGPRVLAMYYQHFEFLECYERGLCLFTCMKDGDLEPFSSLAHDSEKNLHSLFHPGLLSDM